MRHLHMIGAMGTALLASACRADGATNRDPNVAALEADIPPLLAAIARAIPILTAAAANSQPDPNAKALGDQLLAATNQINAAINSVSGASNPPPAPDAPQTVEPIGSGPAALPAAPAS